MITPRPLRSTLFPYTTLFRSLHFVQGLVDRGVLFREPPQFRQGQAAPARVVPKHLAGREIPEAEGAGQGPGDRALAGADLPADRDDHWGSAAGSAASTSSSSPATISLLVKRWATVSGWTAERTTCPLSVMTTARVRRP